MDQEEVEDVNSNYVETAENLSVPSADQEEVEQQIAMD